MSNIISTDVSDDLKDRIEAAREEKGDGKESRSATVRRLIRHGLDDSAEIKPILYVIWLSTLLAGAGLLDASNTVGIFGAVGFSVSIAYFLYQR